MKFLITFAFLHIIIQAETVQNNAQLDKSYQLCLTPDGQKGHCKHLHSCILPEFQSDLFKFLDYVCIIERISIGVCCPDTVAKTAGPNFGHRLPDSVATNYADQIEAESEGRAVKPEERGCGVATKQIGKITGGRPADPGEWPWMAALISNMGNKAFCGGVLITDRHILSAAHCFSTLKPREFRIRLGEYDFTKANETRARDFAVLEVRLHVDFDITTYENDIGIIKLQRSTLFNSYIWPICMPPIGSDWENQRGVVTGWGTQFFGGPYSSVLMEVGVPIWKNADCQAVYNHKIHDTAMCAGSVEGGRDSCQGDSGGPLMVQLPNNRWVVAGIVSWGIRCGEPNHPGIYTRVDEYMKWIIENSVF